MRTPLGGARHRAVAQTQVEASPVDSPHSSFEKRAAASPGVVGCASQADAVEEGGCRCGVAASQSAEAARAAVLAEEGRRRFRHGVFCVSEAGSRPAAERRLGRSGAQFAWTSFDLDLLDDAAFSRRTLRRRAFSARWRSTAARAAPGAVRSASARLRRRRRCAARRRSSASAGARRARAQDADARGGARGRRRDRRSAPRAWEDPNKPDTEGPPLRNAEVPPRAAED